MSLVTPEPRQWWLNLSDNTLALVREVVTKDGRPQIILAHAETNPRELDFAVDADEFVQTHRFDQVHNHGDLDVVVRGPSKEFYDVFAFHEKFGLINHVNPGHLSYQKLIERVEFMLEELLEFTEAAGLAVAVQPDPDDAKSHNVEVYRVYSEQDLPQQADALVDLVYVALGTAVMLGLPWDALWDDVQAANMRKVRGETKRGHAVDVTKPEGWVGPKTGELLPLASYTPNEWPNAVVDPTFPPSALRSERDDTQR